jgi:hypothetical protein
MELNSIEQIRFYLCINESKKHDQIYQEYQTLLNAFLHAQSETEYFRLHDILTRVSQQFNNGMSGRVFKHWEVFLKYMNEKIHVSFYKM